MNAVYLSFLRDKSLGSRRSEFILLSGNRGFALVSCIAVMSILLLFSISILNFSAVETRQMDVRAAQAEARANARLALLMGLAQLQEVTGIDQVVTARAGIRSDERTLSNRNWIGAWRTTYQKGSNEQEWPLIGKKIVGGNGIYSHQGTYTDLRYSMPSLVNGKWKDELFIDWLVSSSLAKSDACMALDPADEGVLEILGKGTLGESITDVAYLNDRVLVEKINLSDDGAIAWWTADNNQKASIKPRELSVSENEITSSAGENPKFIQFEGSYPFEDFHEKAMASREKIISLDTSSLSQDEPFITRESLGHFTHDLSYHSPGLFINTALGGLQRDLTPLLFAQKGDEAVTFMAPTSRVSVTPFCSEYPIIPSQYHDVLAPTYSGLRYWGLQRYKTGNSIDTTLAVRAGRIRSNKNWPHGQSDGVTFESTEWAAQMPKIHPIITDSRWHYYFSINGKNIRTHLIPRVCLWNPYSIEMQIAEMVVLMPNPFYQGSGGFHFYFEDEEVERVQDATLDASDAIHRWEKVDADPLGPQYKARLDVEDLFPDRRYLVFILKGTTLAAGECHVFSPDLSTPSVTAGGVGIAAYEEEDISQNRLSSDAAQGEDHFYFDMATTKFKIAYAPSRWLTLGTATQNELNLEKIHDYRAETGELVENFPFILKASNGVIPPLSQLLSSQDHPTLQLVNNGTGGVAPTYYFAYAGSAWGSANTISSFGSLQDFRDAPYKDAPATHQVGAKLCWLDESTTEGNRAPLRYGTSTTTRWDRDHMVYHPATIANWNIRAQLTSRSPISQCAKHWYLFSTGPWILQFIPKTPQDMNDIPQLNSKGTAFVKNPLGLAINYSSSPNVVLFGLPHREYGIHSLAALRHAMLSPYSWHPSYIIGHSLRDPHAPADSTVHPEVVSSADSGSLNHWDQHIGGYRAGFSYGAANEITDSEDLLQVGDAAVTRTLDAVEMTSSDDILPYDIAYEVNQNIWDGYFISSLPLDVSTNQFSSITPVNQRNEINPSSDENLTGLMGKLTSSTAATDTGFWLNGYYYRRSSAFNVNSTSIAAWTAFLSGTVDMNRELSDGSSLNNGLAGFARYRRPVGVAETERLDPANRDAWKGLRSLSEGELEDLAIAIVEEVKLRGPFISMADFVNRRLVDRDDETSRMGALDAAIFKAGLNQPFHKNSIYHTSMINRGKDSDSRDNNEILFKEEYLSVSDGSTVTSQVRTKTWGLPSFLMQSDLLEPLAPALTTRGDTFTIRAYGESKRNGKVVARAYIEAIVERGAHYIDHQHIDNATVDNEANIPTDTALKLNPLTGEITDGNLTGVNKKFGRRYQIKSFRWLNKNEI